MKRVLIVEDDQPICDLIADILCDEGWTVTTASNGADGLAKMRTTRPDLVILDLMMPVLDGFAVLAVRRADAVLRAVPVLAVSAGGAAGMDRARAMGADGCVEKPFELDALLAALDFLYSPLEELAA